MDIDIVESMNSDFTDPIFVLVLKETPINTVYLLCIVF